MVLVFPTIGGGDDWVRWVYTSLKSPWPCLAHRPKPMAGKQHIVTRKEKQGHRTAKTGAKAHKPPEDNVRKPPAHPPPPAHEPPPVHQPPPAHFRAVRGHACTITKVVGLDGALPSTPMTSSHRPEPSRGTQHSPEVAVPAW